MQVKSYKAEGIILNRFNVGEADRILTIFTKRQGKIRCIAKGVRKPTSRKSGHVELFDLTSLFFAKGKNLDILTQAEVIERFKNLGTSLKATKAAFHLVELINHLLPENQENIPVFNLLVACLRIIDSQKFATRKQINGFERQLLIELGYGKQGERNSDELREQIESIVEKRLASVKIFKDV